MKRRLGYIAVGLVIVLALLFVFRYYTGLSIAYKIPQEATKVVQINLRQIEKDILLDVLGHPLKYTRKKRRRKDSLRRKFRSLTKGVSIPKAVYFYTSKNHLGWRSTKITMINRAIFERFLFKEGFKKSIVQEVTIYSWKQIHFYLKEHTLVIGISEEPVVKTVSTLFKEREFLDENEPWLQALTSSNAELTLVTKKHDILKGAFNKGVFELSGNLGNEFDLLLPTNRANNENDLMAFNVRINPKYSNEQGKISKKIKAEFENFTHLSTDSICPNLTGNFALRMTDIGSIQDTIVTYTYDDDFNKVETISYQNGVLPNLEMRIGTKTDTTLVDYFLRQDAIQIIEGNQIFTPIPIYTTRASQTDNEFILTSGQVETLALKTSTKLYLDFKPKRYIEKPLEIPMSADLRNFLTKTSAIQIEIDANNQLKGAITFINPNRNFLAQLIKP